MRYRKETGQLHLSLEVFKLLLCWLEKILSVPDGRYPKGCLLKITQISNNRVSQNDDKYNWCKQINKNFLDLVGEYNFWMNISTELLELKKYKLIEEYRKFLKSNDKKSCIELS